MDDFRFDETTHVYTLDGRRLPSVTGVLDSCGIINSQWYSAGHALRGSMAHQAIHFYNENDLDMDSVDPAILPYLRAYIRFMSESGFKPHLVEQRMYSEALGLAGTLDITGWLNSEYDLIDIKSGTLPKWVGLQLAGYLELLRESANAGRIKIPQLPGKRFVLVLRADGQYRLIQSTAWTDRGDFLAALAVHKYKESIGA